MLMRSTGNQSHISRRSVNPKRLQGMEDHVVTAMPRGWPRVALRFAICGFGLLPLGLVGLTEARVGEELVRVMEVGFSLQCHRVPDRFLQALDLPVCGRCFGIYLGMAVAAAGEHLVRKVAPVWVLFGLGTAAMLIDVLTERLGLRSGNAELRCLIGLVFGASGAWLTLARMRSTGRVAWREVQSRRTT